MGMHRQAKGHDELRARAPGAAVSCGCGEEGIDLLQRLLQRVRSPAQPLVWRTRFEPAREVVGEEGLASVLSVKHLKCLSFRDVLPLWWRGVPAHNADEQLAEAYVCLIFDRKSRNLDGHARLWQGHISRWHQCAMLRYSISRDSQR